MDEFGIAWIDPDGSELGSPGGAADADAASREAAVGLTQIYRGAARAVVYRGSSLAAGEVVAVIDRHGRRYPI